MLDRRRQFPSIPRSWLLALLAITCACSSPLAGLAQDSDKTINCKDVEKGIGQNTYTLTICASRANLAARARLDSVFKEVRAVIKGYYKDNDGIKILDESQASWYTWKKNEAKLCTYSIGAGSGAGGSGYEMQLNYCAALLTDQRTKELKKYLVELRSR